MNRYMVEMRNSGYSEKYRYDTLVNTLTGYRRKVKAEEDGIAPLYREGHVGARARYMSRIGAPANWFRGKKMSKYDLRLLIAE